MEDKQDAQVKKFMEVKNDVQVVNPVGENRDIQMRKLIENMDGVQVMKN